MIIPFEELKADVLWGILEEFVSREGTDYGQHEFSLEQKIAQVLRQLEHGQAVIVFDPASEICSIVPVRVAADREKQKNTR